MTLIVDGRFSHNPWHDFEHEPARPGVLLQPHALYRLSSLSNDGDVSLAIRNLDPADAQKPTLGFIVEPTQVAALTGDLQDAAALIVIEFEQPADGRGYSIARRLRDAGYKCELRARGPLIPDHYPMLLACGFNSVEISAEDACRYGEAAWSNACHDRPQRTFSGARCA